MSNTGYPSVDRPWLKYYDEDAEKRANDIPANKTVWDVIEERLYKYIDIPALEYFGRVISRKEFIDNVYLWAKVFKSLGVKENEVVAYYGPFMPDVCYMTFALNIIGACPYFLKLAISPEALAEETKDCRIAIVFDQMWGNVSNEFSKDRFDKVIIARITDAMPAPKKQIVALLFGLHNNVTIPNGEKYISVLEARKLEVSGYEDIKATFIPERNAFITSSSGTTGGEVKGIVATNEMALTLLSFGYASRIPFSLGDKVLNNFPPTAATSIHALFFTPLYRGGTVVMDPRVSEKDFYKQVMKFKPNIVLITGSAWESFFNRVEVELAKGKSFDFSCATYWIVGGEGTEIHKYRKWNSIITKCGGKSIYSGYGQSELFSATCVESPFARYDAFFKPVMTVGIPYAGITMGVFDEEGRELKYNQRGELRIRSKSAMKGYYNKPELTAKTKVNGWILTGDLAEIDENGFVYIWGRVKDAIVLPSGRKNYMFDVANKIKEKSYIDDAIVIQMPSDDGRVNVAAHIVWDRSVKENEKTDYLEELNEEVKRFEPEINLCVYTFHDKMLPYSPTTLKKDKNRMAKQLEGYIQVCDGEIKKIRFIDAGGERYRLENA